MLYDWKEKYKKMMAYYDQYVVVWACFEDMLKAIGDRPKLFRWLMRLFMGRYAWTEMILGKRNLESNYMNVGDFGYGLQDCDYHKDKSLRKWDYDPSWHKKQQ